jgi:hypothetical protein
VSDSALYPATKTELLDMIAAARAELDATLAGFSDAEMVAGSEPLDWSVKDHLAHLAAWVDGVAAMLNHQSRWQTMNLTAAFVEQSSEDEINDNLYHQHKAKSLAEVRAWFNDANQRLVDAINRLDEADLQRLYRYFQPDEPEDGDTRPILWWIIHNSYIHYRMHRTWMVEKVTRIRA